MSKPEDSKKFSDEEKEVAQILLELPRLIFYKWNTKRKRSDCVEPSSSITVDTLQPWSSSTPESLRSSIVTDDEPLRLAEQVNEAPEPPQEETQEQTIRIERHENRFCLLRQQNDQQEVALMEVEIHEEATTMMETNASESNTQNSLCPSSSANPEEEDQFRLRMDGAISLIGSEAKRARQSSRMREHGKKSSDSSMADQNSLNLNH